MDDLTASEIIIEWPDQYGIQQASISDNFEKLKEDSQKAMNLAMGSIQTMAYKISHTIHGIELAARPDEVEVEFSIKLDLEGFTVVPMVAKTTAGGQFTVKFKWTIEKPDQPKVLISANDRSS
jgi:hypothetical protein